MQRLTIEVGSFGVNCSLVEIDGRTYIIDPGGEGERIERILRDKGLVPHAILLTHAHFDHIGAVPHLQRVFAEIPVYVTEDDARVITHPFNQLVPEYPPIAMPSNIHDAHELGDFKVIDTPGHTPGGVCYYLESDGVLFSGDTLFAGAYGRTDLPGGDPTKLVASLKKLLDLPGGTLVIPGHGSHTTIAKETWIMSL